jgi:cytochrome c-type biogenesis protein CcmH/NrfG
LESLATLSPGLIAFVVAMAAGMIAHGIWQQVRMSAQRQRLLASATDG